MSMDYVDQNDIAKVKIIIEKDGWKKRNGIPEGWYFKEKFISREIKKHFLSDKGDRFKSPKEAMKYLLVNKYPKNSIDEFRKTFNPTLGKKATLKNTQNNLDEIKKEKTKQIKTITEPQKVGIKLVETISYVEKDFLPEGWMTNGKYYRSPDWQLFKNLHETVIAMQNKGFSDTEIDKVKMHGSKIPFRKKPCLPAGWMCCEIEGREGMSGGGKRTMTWYLSPEGRIFQNRASTIKFLVENRCPQKDIEIMKSLLISEDKWEFDQNLPDGWMIKQMAASPVIFLTPTWESMKHKSNVLDYMKKNDYNDTVIATTKKYLYDNPKLIFSTKRIKNIFDCWIL